MSSIYMKYIHPTGFCTTKQADERRLPAFFKIAWCHPIISLLKTVRTGDNEYIKAVHGRLYKPTYFFYGGKTMFKMKHVAISVTVLFTLAGFQTVFAASNAELEKRIEKLEQGAVGSPEGSPLGQISEWVTLSGAIEIEISHESSDVSDTDDSDISLATAELGIEATPQEWVTGFMLIKWEDEDSEMIIDEAHVTLGATEDMPYYLSAGKIYVPFGAYETMMISDPITLDLGETRDNALQAGIEINGFSAAVYTFNGEAEEASDTDDTIDIFGFSFGYGMESDAYSFNLGVDWINNILESGGLVDVYDTSGWSTSLDDKVAGYAIYASVNFGPVCLIGEYVAMADDATGGGSILQQEITAYAVEAGYTFEVSGYETTIAIGYQASDDAADILPESKILGSVGVGITDNLSVAAEYACAENNSVADGGDSDEIDTFTLKLAFEF